MSHDYGDRTSESIPKGDETLLTAKQTWEALGISRGKLYRMMDAGKIFPIPVNPLLERPLRHYFTLAEVERVKREAEAAKAQD